MKLTFKDIPFAIHDCGLVNFKLQGETYHFRLGIPGYKAVEICDQITDESNEMLILDIILHKVQLKEIYFPTTDFNIVDCEVYDFYIDENGEAEITFFESKLPFTINLKCESNEVIPVKVIHNDQWYNKDLTKEDYFEIK